MSGQIPGLEQFPKMVYPGTKEGEMGNPGAGVIVKNEDEEKHVMSGKRLEDFGKPEKPADEPKAEGWDKK